MLYVILELLRKHPYRNEILLVSLIAILPSLDVTDLALFLLCKVEFKESYEIL